MSNAGADAPVSPSARPYVILNGVYFREEGKWIGECEELGTATFGDTLEEVQDELADLVRLHLNTLEDIGERKQFFERHGIKMYSDAEVAPRVDRQEETTRERLPGRKERLPFVVPV